MRAAPLRSIPAAPSPSHSALVFLLGSAQAPEHPILHSDFSRDKLLNDHLLRLYGKCGCLDEACRVFDGIPHKDVYTWTAMIGAYAQAGGAKCIFDKMPEKNAVTWNAMITTYAKAGHLEEEKNLFDRMPHWTLISCNIMLVSYTIDHDLKCVLDLLDSMQERNVFTWNTMITAFAQEGQL
ncbi:pentatricopeptide repeat-containing protein At2g35030, mitochondrial-like [Selaginella moellendorffii]|uniref:pentatricopeptide repeat-containing protein At2g35030, mitochondrial-like n=1 Tax=Selaginella moellendorffii TaxID=88036 RepID=UPI000D1CD320|nr:pentatricopeptide repeat-containing protein At2g35030, mitochondrial-like [Selaginella moellendorffii]|eukprot:XP_024527339.1 pentatricopeptide repeat-containing protein At2g35030, mitochondrial-like [Selaginella moellendorffii]